MSNKMFTPCALSWLQSLLRERVSPHVDLKQTKTALTISHRGHAGQLVFDVLEPEFTRAGYNPSFSLWDASHEGWAAPLGRPLPAPAMSRREGPLVELIGKDCYFHYDVLGLAYWALNRVEEIAATDLDVHGRFKAASSHAYRHGYLDRPYVDEWLEILKQALGRLWSISVVVSSKFSTWVSHDVDRPSRYGFTTVPQLLRRMGSDLVRRGRIFDLLKAPAIRRSSKERLHPCDPWNTFSWLMDISERHGLRSTFFFMCGRTHPNFDASYELEHSAIQHLIYEIQLRGHEIGLHPSYNSYMDEASVKREAQRLINTCADNGLMLENWGSRMHYLRWSHPATLEILASVGAAYDSSMTYADRCGFRCGTCHDFMAFSPLEDKILDLRIRPLIVMESSIIKSMALGDGAEAYAKFVELKSACRAVGGVFSLLWHNSSLDSAQVKNLYNQVIAA